MNGYTIRTFLSANTCGGFFSYFDGFLKDKKAFVIKGGPGTGKSSFMKKVASKAVAKGEFTEYVYCSSDPDSLDGIYVHGADTVFVDGTPPHVTEPEYPGVMGGIVDMGQFINGESISAFKNDIVYLNSGLKARYSRAYRYLRAADSISSELCETALRFTDKAAAVNHFEQLFAAICRDKMGHGGNVYKRFLSGITPKGFVTFKDTIYTLCSDVFVVKDKYGIGHFIMEHLRNEAVERGFDVYEFHSPLNPAKIAHLAIPGLDAAIVSSNKTTPFDTRNTRAVDLTRFIGEDIALEQKNAVSASKIMKICMDEACVALSSAKAIHDDLEDIYISAMDFDEMDKYTEKYCDMV